MPMPHMGGNGDHVARADRLRWLSLLLHQSQARSDDQGLSQWMGMPSGAGACIKAHRSATCTARRLCLKWRADAHRAREGFG